MNWSKKGVSLLFVFLLLFSIFNTGRADASCFAIRNPLTPILEEVTWTKDGLFAYVEAETAYTEYMYLLFTDRRGKEQARIPVTLSKAKTQSVPAQDLAGQKITVKVRSGQIHLTKKEVDLSAGNYTVTLEVSNYDPQPAQHSQGSTLVVPEEGCSKTKLQSKASTITIDAEENIVFPGSVEISNGTIQLTINLTSTYSTAKFYLLIHGEDGNLVKQMPISTKNPKITAKSLNLSPGTYYVQLMMTYQGEDIYSRAAMWSIPEPTVPFSIPSGERFPGGITVSSTGTITITLQAQSIVPQYDYYLVILDSNAKEVRRIFIDPRNPVLSTKQWGLGTGGYSLVIEVVDPNSQEYATSVSTFFTVNQTGQIIVFIDGQLQSYSKPPVKINSRVLVPMRAVFEAFGAKVDWDEATQTVTATKDGDVIQLTIGSKIAYKNGQKITMDVPAILYNNETTMVPIRFVSEALGARVSWDGYSNSVIISN